MKLKTLLLGLLLSLSFEFHGQNVMLGVEYVLGEYMIEEANYFPRTFELNHTIFIMEINRKIKKIEPFIRTEVWCQGIDLKGMQPRINTYMVGVNYYPSEKIKIRYEHSCTHKVFSTGYESKDYFTGVQNKIGIYYKF